MSEEQVVLVDVADGVMTVTLNRPKAKNAVNRALAEGIAAAMDELDGNDDIRVAVITGAGGSFCSGMDLKAFVEGGMPNLPERGFAGITEKAADKPLIAAVEGFALAGGLEIALSCDLLVASKGAKLGIPEVGVGLFAGAGALSRLPRRVPYGLAMQMALTGEPITAEIGHEFGLVQVLTEKGEALDGALDLAARVAKNAPLGLVASKRLIRDLGGVDGAFWGDQQPLIDSVFSSSDAIEGATAFAEKRAPNWTGQ